MQIGEDSVGSNAVSVFLHVFLLRLIEQTTTCRGMPIVRRVAPAGNLDLTDSQRGQGGGWRLMVIRHRPDRR